MNRYDQKNMMIAVRARELNEERLRKENELKKQKLANSALEQTIKEASIPVELMSKARQDVEKELEEELRLKEIEEQRKQELRSFDKKVIKVGFLTMLGVTSFIIGTHYLTSFIVNSIKNSDESTVETVVKEEQISAHTNHKLNHEGWEKAIGFQSEEIIHDEKRFTYEIDHNDVKINIDYKLSDPIVENLHYAFGDSLFVEDYDCDGVIDRLHFMDGEYSMGNKQVNDSFVIVFPTVLFEKPFLNGITLEEGLELRESLQKQLQEFEEQYEMDKKVKHYIVDKEDSSAVKKILEE